MWEDFWESAADFFNDDNKFYVIMVVAAGIGIWCGAVYIVSNSVAAGYFVRRLIRLGADSPETAVLMRDIRTTKKGKKGGKINFAAAVSTPFVKNVLGKNGLLRGVVFEANDKIELEDRGFQGVFAVATERQPRDFKSAKFYIPPPLLGRARDKFAKRDNGIPSLVLALTLITLFTAVMMMCMPWFINLVSSIFQ